MENRTKRPEKSGGKNQKRERSKSRIEIKIKSKAAILTDITYVRKFVGVR